MLRGETWYFSEVGDEFAITRPDIPRPWRNFLWNERFLSTVEQTGRGYSKLVTPEGHSVELVKMGAMFDKANSRHLYVRDDESGDFWNVGWYPAKADLDSYRCVHGLGYTVIESARGGIEARWRIFVPLGKDPVELWSVTLRNASAGRRRVSIFPFLEFSLRGATTYGHVHFLAGHYEEDAGLILAENRAEDEPCGCSNGFMASSYKPTSYDVSRTRFLGRYGLVDRPEAVVRGRCASISAAREVMCGCLHRRLNLKGGQELTVNLVVGLCSDLEEARELASRHLSGGAVERNFGELKSHCERLYGNLKLSAPDADASLRVSTWNQHQVAYGASWVRWGWKGYRDVLQHARGVLLIDPDLARRDIVEALTYQYSSGFGVHGWRPLSPRFYADSALWLVFAVVEYVKETGGLAFLGRQVPYLDGGDDTVLGHLVAAVRASFSDRGEHGLCRMHGGDWNDSLTRVGVKGRGESVWNSQALAAALRDLEGMVRRARHEELAREMRDMYREIAEAINEHAWDPAGWYIRGYDDEGRPFGDSSCAEGKIYLNSQSWAVISGVADGERTALCLDAVGKHLKVPYGYLTLSPPYTRYDARLGRITSMPPGTGENGAVYCHANAFLCAALCLAERTEEGYRLYRLMSPTNSVNPPEKSGAPPFAYPNSYYGPAFKERPGWIEGYWTTGSASWWLRNIVDLVCGVRPDYDGLLVDPRLPSRWKEVKLRRGFRGDVYDITIHNPGRLSKGSVSLTLDGGPLPSNLIHPVGDGKSHRVDAVISSS